MRCYVCGRKFGDGELVVPVMRYVVNEKRGDFVPMQGEQFLHARHLKDTGARLLADDDIEPSAP